MNIKLIPVLNNKISNYMDNKLLFTTNLYTFDKNMDISNTT